MSRLKALWPYMRWYGGSIGLIYVALRWFRTGQVFLTAWALAAALWAVTRFAARGVRS